MPARVRAVARAAAIGAVVTAARVVPAAAQSNPPGGDGSGGGGSPVPNPAPDAGIPGSELITELLGWLKYAALAAAVAGFLLGAIAIGVGYTGANYGASAAGRRWLLGGLGAAVLAGLAHTIAVTLYEAT